MELSIGWACLLPLFFGNAAISTLLGMIYKEKERKISCCELMRMLLGVSEIPALWGRRAKELITMDSAKAPHFFKLRVLHGAMNVAAYGAIVTCTLVATVRPLAENPEIFVEITMILAHFFYIACIVGISGTDLPCRRTPPENNTRTPRVSSSASSSSKSSSTVMNDNEKESSSSSQVEVVHVELSSRQEANTR
jgi:hypothetical protein